MKRLHDDALWCWSAFDEARNMDFNSYLWVREAGNVVVDPLPLSDHDRAQLIELGGVAWIVITNSDHVRDAKGLVEATGARVAGPRAERESFPIACTRWLGAGDRIPETNGAEVLEMHGSKTPGELALVLGGDTLITGDLVRAQRGGSLQLLPDAKLTDPGAARASVAELATRGVRAVLVGDGWPVFRDGTTRLAELVGHQPT